MTSEELTSWLKRTRKETGLKMLATLFKVAPRTVSRWIDAGLPEYIFAGERAAALYDTEDAGERWGFQPLACIYWAAQRVMPEPPLLKLLREDFPRWYEFAHKYPDDFPAYAEEYPGFSWPFCLAGERWSSFAAWFWQVYFVDESDGKIDLCDCPLTPIRDDSEKKSHWSEN